MLTVPISPGSVRRPPVARAACASTA
jgi:hypothetical protein